MTLSWFEAIVALPWGLFVGLGFVTWVRRDSARVLCATAKAGPRTRLPARHVRIVITALAVFAPALGSPVSVSASLMGFLVGRNLALRVGGATPRPRSPRRAQSEVVHAH